MKISSDLKPRLEKGLSEQKSQKSGMHSFGTIVKKEESQLQLNELNRMMEKIEAAGANLARSRRFGDLVKYKNLVKRFVQEAVDYGMELKHSQSWDYNGRSRKHAIVEEVDKHLLDLTGNVMKSESKSIDIVGKIGEIKGLLINLYM